MTSEVVIDVKSKEISIALMEDKNLVEYQNESRAASFSVGNIYIAKVKKQGHPFARFEERRQHSYHIKCGPRSDGTDCEGAYLYERSSSDW